MRPSFPMILALALVCTPAAARSSDLGPVRFEVGVTGVELDDSYHWTGRGGAMGVSVPATPWLSIGGEAAFARLDLSESDFDRTDDSRLDTGTLMATFRIMPPVERGFAPFLLSQSGVGWIRETHRQSYLYYDGVNLSRYSTSSRYEKYELCAAIGGGVRGVWPRPIPTFELTLRSVMLGGDFGRSMLASRLSLTY